MRCHKCLREYSCAALAISCNCREADRAVLSKFLNRTVQTTVICTICKKHYPNREDALECGRGHYRELVELLEKQLTQLGLNAHMFYKQSHGLRVVKAMKRLDGNFTIRVAYRHDDVVDLSTLIQQIMTNSDLSTLESQEQLQLLWKQEQKEELQQQLKHKDQMASELEAQILELKTRQMKLHQDCAQLRINLGEL